MKKQRRNRLQTPQKREIFLRCASSVVLVFALLCDLFLIGKLMPQTMDGTTDPASTLPENVSFGMVVLCLALYELFRFFTALNKDKNDKFNYFYLGYMGLDVVAGVLSFFAKISGKAAVAACVIYMAPFFIRRILYLVRHHKKVRDYFFNITAVLLATILVMGLLGGEKTFSPSFMLLGLFIFLGSLGRICKAALSNFNNEILRKIVRKTYAGEIVFGLLLLIVAFSLVLMRMEENIKSFGDGLWYCFMLVTTIGLGDVTVTGTLGRVLSVILGVYGIIVVAILTSIIVNFYNEVKNVDDDKKAEDVQPAVSESSEAETDEQPAIDTPKEE